MKASGHGLGFDFCIPSPIDARRGGGKIRRNANSKTKTLNPGSCSQSVRFASPKVDTSSGSQTARCVPQVKDSLQDSKPSTLDSELSAHVLSLCNLHPDESRSLTLDSGNGHISAHAGQEKSFGKTLPRAWKPRESAFPGLPSLKTPRTGAQGLEESFLSNAKHQATDSRKLLLAANLNGRNRRASPRKENGERRREGNVCRTRVCEKRSHCALFTHVGCVDSRPPTCRVCFDHQVVQGTSWECSH